MARKGAHCQVREEGGTPRSCKGAGCRVFAQLFAEWETIPLMWSSRQQTVPARRRRPPPQTGLLLRAGSSREIVMNKRWPNYPLESRSLRIDSASISWRQPLPRHVSASLCSRASLAGSRCPPCSAAAAPGVANFEGASGPENGRAFNARSIARVVVSDFSCPPLLQYSVEKFPTGVRLFNNTPETDSPSQ